MWDTDDRDANHGADAGVPTAKRSADDGAEAPSGRDASYVRDCHARGDSRGDVREECRDGGARSLRGYCRGDGRRCRGYYPDCLGDDLHYCPGYCRDGCLHGCRCCLHDRDGLGYCCWDCDRDCLGGCHRCRDVSRHHGFRNWGRDGCCCRGCRATRVTTDVSVSMGVMRALTGETGRFHDHRHGCLDRCLDCRLTVSVTAGYRAPQRAVPPICRKSQLSQIFGVFFSYCLNFYIINDQMCKMLLLQLSL